jgi:RNA polymerase sigma-70 factor (ECF subfamily)
MTPEPTPVERARRSSSAGDRPHDGVLGVVSDFDAFFAAQYRPVLGLAFVLSGSAVAAEDLTQDAFVAAYRRWGEVSALERPEAWVRRVVANRAVSRWRRVASEARALARLRAAREPVLALDARDEATWAAVRALPRRQAQVIALVYLEDRALDDVSTILDVSVETVRTHLKRARRALEAELRSEEDR